MTNGMKSGYLCNYLSKKVYVMLAGRLFENESFIRFPARGGVNKKEKGK